MSKLIKKIEQWWLKRHYDKYAQRLGYKDWKEYVDRTILKDDD